ncbi:MAG: hypothetical protein K6T85_12725 [Gorillibacterium sp.]|nr:hypothetical protein [Gorillibacterium sp.]
MQLIFRDSFFSAGRTDIVDASGNPAGVLDLGSAFSAKVEAYNAEGRLACKGKFRHALSSKWLVLGPAEEELGLLRSRMSFLSKRYEYEAYGRGVFEITSPAFSREYEVTQTSGQLVARFERINGFFSSGAFRLDNQLDSLDSYELTVVIMGVHAIQKSQQAAASGGAN